MCKGNVMSYRGHLPLDFLCGGLGTSTACNDHCLDGACEHSLTYTHAHNSHYDFG